MDDFTKLVKRCADKLENHTIFNASTAHAIILFKNLLEVAAKQNEEVKIFSGCFDPTVYNSLVETVTNALNNGIKISLISECSESELANNSFVNIVRNHANGEVRALAHKVGLPHFILVGKSRYRVELDDALKSARANFDDAVTGNTLLSFYNKLIHTPTAVA